LWPPSILGATPSAGFLGPPGRHCPTPHPRMARELGPPRGYTKVRESPRPPLVAPVVDAVIRPPVEAGLRPQVAVVGRIVRAVVRRIVVAVIARTAVVIRSPPAPVPIAYIAHALA